MRTESSKGVAFATDEGHIPAGDSSHSDFARRTVDRVFVTARRSTFKFSSPILNKLGAGDFFLEFYYLFARIGEKFFKIAFFFFDLGEHLLNERKMMPKDDT